jgi:hypothetical protein
MSLTNSRGSNKLQSVEKPAKAQTSNLLASYVATEHLTPDYENMNSKP